MLSARAFVRGVELHVATWFEVFRQRKVLESAAPRDEIDGFPLEYVAYSQGMKLSMTASVIDKQAQSDSVFEIPQKVRFSI